jgi:pimeloyl-ACP methyl ester carboxylesterase
VQARDGWPLPMMVNPPHSKAPGEFTQTGAHRLHYRLTGSAPPTIICEAGLGCGSETWCAIQGSLSESMTVLSYDRAGLMHSQLRHSQLTVEAVVSDLRSLISHTTPPRPYVFVGHSYGGVLIRHFAQRFPDLVDAIVFVECIQPEHLRQLPILRVISQTKGLLIRLAGFARSKPPIAEILFRVAHPLIWLRSSLKYRRYTTRYGPAIINAVCAQPLATLCATAAEVKTIEYFTSTVPDGLTNWELPVTVVAAGQPLTRRQFPGSTQKDRRRYTFIHQQLQKDLTKLSSRAEFILDKDSAHNVPVDNPDLLVREIKKVANKLIKQ